MHHLHNDLFTKSVLIALCYILLLKFNQRFSNLSFTPNRISWVFVFIFMKYALKQLDGNALAFRLAWRCRNSIWALKATSPCRHTTIYTVSAVSVVSENDDLQCLMSTQRDTQIVGFQTCYSLNMWVSSVAVQLTGRQKALNGQSSWKLMFVLILFSSWLLQTGGSFNLDVPSVTCDSVEIAAVWVYWLRRKSEGNTTPSSQ